MEPFALWTASEIAAAAAGRVTADFVATGVSIDSRSVEYGDLFVAIAGPNFDGHDYVAAALQRGAAGAVVSRLPDGVADTAPLVMVADTLKALEMMGRAARHRSGARVVAVTGSVGKTSTKEALRLCLSAQGATHASIGSLNNHWGVPLTLSRLPRDVTYAVFEIGMNHADEIRPLAKMVEPHVAIITTVEAVHLENFPDEGAIADAKAEIFDGVVGDGAVVLNRDNRWYDRLAAGAAARGIKRIIGFGFDERAESRVLSYRLRGDGSDVEAVIVGSPVRFSLAMPGKHWIQNAVGVLTAVKAMGGDVVMAAIALGRMTPPKGRGQRFVVDLPAGGSATVIDDSYNASPPSMRAAFATLAAGDLATGARRIAVLGDMLELGPDELSLHAALADDIAAAGIDLVFTAGRRMQALAERLPAARSGGHADTAQALLPAVAAALRDGDVVVVKGSHGSRMDLVVSGLTAPTAPPANG